MGHTIKNATPPPPPYSKNRLGERIERMLQRFLIGVLNTVKETIKDIIGAGLELFLEILEPALIRIYGPLLRMVADEDDTPTELKSAINQALSGEDQAGAGVLLSLGAAAGGTVMNSALGVLLSESVTYPLNRKITPARPDPSVATAISWRDPMLGNVMHDFLRDQGWDEAIIAAFENVFQQRASERDLLTAWLREELSEGDLSGELRKRGWRQPDINIIKALAHRLPGPGDLVQFALREVWRGDLRPELLSPNAPGRYYELMKKQGFSHEFAEDYWAAHWALPSAGQGFQAFWRVPDFTESDLRQLLTRLDILPRYHDELIEIAYQPLTRVDIRRMHAIGTLSNEEVLEAYRHHGFSPRDAQRMLDFTIQYNARSERELTKADILGGLNDGMLSASEAERWLIDIEYPPDLAAFLVAREQAQMARKRTNKQLSVIEDLYVLGDISRSEATQRMGALGLAATEIELHLEDWDIDRQKKIKRPTRSNLESFLLQDIIGQSEWREQMARLGYQDQYTDWYLTEILDCKAEDAAEAERKAREEQQKIRKRDIKTDYQIDKAEIDVDIAEVRTAIAETQVALDTRRTRYLAERRLAEQALTEAQLESETERDIAQLEDRIDVRQESIRALRQDIEGYQTDIQRLRVQHQERVEQAQPEVNEVEAAIAALESEIDGHREIIEDLQTQIRAIRSRITTLEANPRLAELDAEIAAVRAQIEDQQVSIDRLQTQIRGIEADIARLEESLPELLERATGEEQAAEIERDAETQILTWRREIAELQVGIEEHQDTIAELQVEIDTLQAERSETAAYQEILDAQVEIAELQERIDEQESLIAQARSEITRRREELRLLKQPAESTRTAIEKLELDIESAQDQIRAFETEIQERRTLTNRRRETLRQDIEALAQLPQLVTIEAEYQNDRARLENRLNSLRVNLRELLESKARLSFEYRETLAEV